MGTHGFTKLNKLLFVIVDASRSTCICTSHIFCIGFVFYFDMSKSKSKSKTSLLTTRKSWLYSNYSQ